MSVLLRPYQEETAERFERFVAQGKQRGAIILPTGTGKTVTALEIARRFGKRTLWLAHRQELIDQPFEALQDVWPDADIGIVKAERDEKDAQDVVLASIQTVSRNDCARLIACGEFGLVIVDEVHHAIADSYVSVIERIGCMNHGGPKLLGLTATPERAGLKDLFDAGVIYSYPLKKAIEEGYLCPIGPTSQIRVPTLDLSKIKTAKGDFVQSALGDAMLSEHVADFTAKGVKHQAGDRRTIVFTVLVQQAVKTAEAMKKLGMAAEVVSGETPEQERRSILAKFYDGQIQVICNAAVLTEGYDNPRVDCVVVARPTKSSILYRQMVGRGLRPHPDKQNLMVIDLVGASERYDIMSAPKFGREINNEGRPKGTGSPYSGIKTPSEQRSALKGLLNVDEMQVPEYLDDDTGGGDISKVAPEPHITISRTLKEKPPEPPPPPPPPPLQVRWLPAKKLLGWFASTSAGVVCVIQVKMKGKFRGKLPKELRGNPNQPLPLPPDIVVWVVAVSGDRARNIAHQLVGVFHTDKMAFGAGADCVRTLQGGKMLGTENDAPWRKEPVSKSQVDTMRGLGINPHHHSTRGAAADAITVELGIRAGREVAAMLREQDQGRPQPLLRDYRPPVRR